MLKIELEFNEREEKILYGMCEALDEPNPKIMIQNLLKKQWQEIKKPKPAGVLGELGIDLKDLGPRALQIVLEHLRKSR